MKPSTQRSKELTPQILMSRPASRPCVGRTRWRTAVAMAVMALVLLGSSVTAAAADCVPITITNQPQNFTASEGCPATFVVGFSGTGPVAVQWWRNGKPIPDATNSSYTVELATIANDDQSRFRVSLSNSCSQALSGEALLSFGGDITRPTLRRARSAATLDRIIVTFSSGACGWPWLSPASVQNPANYSVDGGVVVSNAVLDASRLTVVLETSRQTPGTIYTLAVRNVSDLNGGRIAPDSTIQFQAWVLNPAGSSEAVPPPLAIRRSNDVLHVAWPPGSLLQRSDTPTGPWLPLPYAGNPHPAGTNGSGFFRAAFSP